MGIGDHGGDPLGWWSPDPRGVLRPAELRVTRSLRKSVAHFEVRVDTAFLPVVEACAAPDRDGRWITPPIIEAYVELHRAGWAHSIETWQAGELVGGLYGVAIGGLFAGESMFHHVRDASKVALVGLRDLLMADRDPRRLIDVQWQTPHLATLGVARCRARSTSRRCRRCSGRRCRRAGPDHLDDVCRVVALVSRPAEAVAAHPAPRRHVVRCGGIGGEEHDDVDLRGGAHELSQTDDREGAPLAPGGPDGLTAHSSPTPSSARTAATVGARATVKAATSAARPGETAVSGRVTRTLPCVRTPIAASTWLGSKVLEVQAEPLATANPARSKAPTTASPSTYRLEKVTTCGSLSSGSPTTSVSGTPAAALRMSSTSARLVRASTCRVAAVCCHASAAARASGTQGATSVRPCSTSARASAQCHRTPSRTTRTPSGGPPQERASPTRTSQSAGTTSRPRDAIASTTSGTP